MKTKSCLALLMILLVFSCNGGRTADASREAANRALGIEPKYLLKDCFVLVNFEWTPGVPSSAKDEVVQDVIAAMGEATVITRRLPMFFGHSTREASYFAFYYADQCEDRVALTKRFIDEFVRPNSKSFPKYSIVSEGLEPGFDGVMPSGAWISDDK